MTTPEELGALDELAAALATRAQLSFGTARTGAERDVALGLRQAAVAEKRWDAGAGSTDGDAFDSRAVHVIGWRKDEPICCGRLVLPPGPLPTEVACGFVIGPAGRVVDVGRMVVVPGARDHGSGVFLALLAALYLETRARGFTTGCGMMAPNVRGLVRLLGVPLDVLGPDHEYRGERRAPVRFDVGAHGPDVVASWRRHDGA